jgi:hypothetical protein
MQIPWENLAPVQNFFQLNFLFSGLEVSSNTLLLARLTAFLVFGVGLMWLLFRIIVKVLDCIQAFVASLGSLPKSFYLLLLLVVPISSDSLGAKWTGYILLVMSLFGVVVTVALVLVLWKYGVDQALRLINNLRSHQHEKTSNSCSDRALPPDNVVRPLMDPPVMRSEGRPTSWPVSG